MDKLATLVINSLSDPRFVTYITEYNPDIVIFCGDYNLLHSSNNKTSAEWANQKVIIHNQNVMHDIHLIELIEKARFSYLPLRLVSRYGMIRLIDSRITYELLQREFVVPTRTRTISKHHEQIRTLEDIVDMDKAGMIVSPEIGLHENVAVLDFNDEYANLILRHNISYETSVNSQDRASEQQHRSPINTETQTTLLPAIME